MTLKENKTKPKKKLHVSRGKESFQRTPIVKLVKTTMSANLSNKIMKNDQKYMLIKNNKLFSM